MDIRLDLNFFIHIKTVKLYKKLGDAGIVCLQKLWVEAARFEPDGILDMTEEDIEYICGWIGTPGLFINTLCQRDTQFLDRLPNGDFKLHNWEKRQPHVASSPERSEKYRKNAMARWSKYAEGKAVAFKRKQSEKPRGDTNRGRLTGKEPERASKEEMLKLVQQIGAGKTLVDAALKDGAE